MPKSTPQTEDLEVMAGYVRDEEGNLIPDYDMAMINFDDGDVVVGEVVRIDRDEVLVDIGYKSEGVIPIKELAIKSDIDPNEIVSLGEKIEALVLQKEDADGRLILSRKRAEYEKAWERVQKQSDDGELVTGRVIEIVKGGLIIDIGLRGFLPASLVDIRRVKDLNDFVGQRLECKIIEINRNRNNVVLSRRAVLEEEKKEQREQVIDALTRGQVVKGCVSSIVPFGAFVDLDGIDGLIHISELSWDHIDHPSEVLSVGDEVEVQILDVNKALLRISLGYKQLQSDPWEQSVSEYKIGDILDGKVTKIVQFGVFVSIKDGVEGLVHVSEMEEEKELLNNLSENQEIKVKLIEIESDRRRLGLSLKLKDSSEEDGAKSSVADQKAKDTEASVDEKSTDISSEAAVSNPEISEQKLDSKEKITKKAKKSEQEINSNNETATAVIAENEETADTTQKKTIKKKTAKSSELESSADAPEGSLESVLAAMKNELGSKE